MGRLQVMIVLFLMATAAVATATTWQVPAECGTIRAGVDSAAVGDTVLVACGTYYEHDIPLGSGVCLLGASGDPNCVIVDAEHWGRAFRCANAEQPVTISGLTVRNGLSGYEDGGGIYCYFSSVVIRDVVISDNTSYGRGGGLYCDNCEFDLTGVVFQGNQTHFSSAGGGMYSRSSTGTL